MKKVILFTMTGIILLCASCEKNQEGDRTRYYKTTGEGYIWDVTNNRPVAGATITVTTTLNAIVNFKTEETFTTDETGYYQIRFMKRAKDGKVLQYGFEVGSGPMIPPPPPYWSLTNPSNTFPHISVYPEDIKDKKVITFDTVKFYETNIR
ncbi:MAG: hypothetical protein LBH82_00595 [Bacteroidales bacterium]|nr:hypothetical protein [Bacteroidales bacterium]